MSKILQRLQDVDPNDNEAVKELINTIIQKEHILKSSENQSSVALRFVETIVTRFPRYCSQHRNAIENYLSNFLEAKNYYNVITAAKCAHGLQQIRPSQDKMATPKNCWREQMSILCHAAHSLIEAVFANTVNIYKNNKNDKPADINLLAHTPLTNGLSKILNVKKASNGLDRKTILTNKLRNVFVFIQAMLVEVYPVAKPIQPQLILEVILQALSVSSSVSSDISTAAIVKTEALRTLDALISCLGSNLIPFSALVFRFVMQTLRWSSDNPSDESRKVRCTAYNSLNKWLSVLHVYAVPADSRGSSWQDDVTTHVVQDITPVQKVVTLTMSNQHTKNLSKKARRKLANTMLQQSSIANHMPEEKNKIDTSAEVNDEVAIAALECAETYLTVCGIFLKPATHKIFQDRLVRECYNMEHTSQRLLHLLRALDSARKNVPNNVPPPTQYCLSLYSRMLDSRNEEIGKFCSRALLDIRLHLHCSPPTLNFAIDAQQKTNNVEDKRKKISKKNRAVLESLLGEDRMPPEADSEEVINIADEPANKKPRLDDTSDQISLSSDSEQSIEISDSEEDIEIVTEAENLTEQTETNNVEQTNENVNEEITETEFTNTENEEISQPIETEVNISNIYDAKTQIPVNTSNDIVDGGNSPSMEITYDCTVNKEIPVLEKIDGENLPSTNETDDIQITCGQIVKDSQDSVKKVDETNEVVKENGTGEVYENGVESDVEKNEASVEVKVTTKEISVEDMLADFVDEVVEEGKAEA